MYKVPYVGYIIAIMERAVWQAEAENVLKNGVPVARLLALLDTGTTTTTTLVLVGHAAAIESFQHAEQSLRIRGVRITPHVVQTRRNATLFVSLVDQPSVKDF